MKPYTNKADRTAVNAEYEALSRWERAKIRARTKRKLYKEIRHYQREVIAARRELAEVEALYVILRQRFKDGT